jgi:hypothetical protein
MVVGDVSDMCVIHDRHKDILQATNDIKEGSEERNKVAQWSYVHSRWCMRHMGANFHSHFKNKELTQLSSAYVRPIRRKRSTTYG